MFVNSVYMVKVKSFMWQWRKRAQQKNCTKKLKKQQQHAMQSFACGKLNVYRSKGSLRNFYGTFV